ncbi:MAG: glutaredoxin family protein [Methanomicrobiaceae archaeon]|nr:glutaredoxin family protein [Methanomicrobiaceae archaeon]
MEIMHVNGRDVGEVLLYALSTCQWCRKTKELLEESGVAFDYVYVDLLPEKKMEEVFEEIRKCNPRLGFPTVRIGGECIVGYQEERIREGISA